jgi:uncharacterized membrane protein (UPF0182 family)
VEPVYLQAKQEQTESAPAAASQPRGFAKQQRRGAAVSSQPDTSTAAALPELKRVIAAFSNRLGMAENLDKALTSVLGGHVFTQQAGTGDIRRDQTVSELGAMALEHYVTAQDHLRNGKWAEYGKAIEKLESVLREISRAAGEE